MVLNIDLLERNFASIVPKASELTTVFYTHLFKNHPELRPMFPTEMAVQKKKLGASLALVVANLRNPKVLTASLGELGIRHIDYNVKREHYPIIGKNLLVTLAEISGDQWTEELEEAWAQAYEDVVKIIFSALDNYEKRHAA